MSELFMGELKPFYGKWNWPLKDMQPGMYFTVDHVKRDPEAVRSYVSMQGSRLGKYFSINASDPEHPGFCRVTCTPPPTERVEIMDGGVLDYEKARVKISQWYGVSLDEIPALWGALMMKQRAFIPVEQVEMPPIPRLIVMTEVRDGWIGLVFKKDGLDFHPLMAGTALGNWKVEDEPSDPLAEIFE